MSKMGMQKGTTAMVLFNLRKGFNLRRACEQAGLGRGAMTHRRKLDPQLNTQVLELLKKNNSSTPTGKQNVHLAGRGTTIQPGTVAWWRAWDLHAHKGTLRRRYGMSKMKLRPPARKRLVLGFDGR